MNNITPHYGALFFYMFYMLPEFKPMTAMVILTGAALGVEAGFLTGAVTMLVSNIIFSQGPWTAWQMAAMGLVGLLSGRRGIIVKSNDETGLGRSDIIVKNKAKRVAVVIETKRAKTKSDIEKLSRDALEQIDINKYYVPFRNEKVIKYGIAFWGKECYISAE